MVRNKQNVWIVIILLIVLGVSSCSDSDSSPTSPESSVNIPGGQCNRSGFTTCQNHVLDCWMDMYQFNPCSHCREWLEVWITWACTGVDITGERDADDYTMCSDACETQAARSLRSCQQAMNCDPDVVP